jgi:glycosidase
MAALTYVLPQGQPLVYTGQEIGYNARFEFFEKDPVEAWEANEWTDFYKSLIAMRHSNPALCAGERGGEIQYLEPQNENIMAFYREVEGNKVVAIFNLTASPQKVQFAEPFEGYKCGLTGEEATLSQEFEMAPWGYYIVVK